MIAFLGSRSVGREDGLGPEDAPVSAVQQPDAAAGVQLAGAGVPSAPRTRQGRIQVQRRDLQTHLSAR